MLTPKLLVRVARRLQEVLRARAIQSNQARCYSLKRLREASHGLVQALHQLDRAQGIPAIVPRLEEQLPSPVQATLNACTQARQALEQQRLAVPDLGTVIAELRQLEVEFGGLHIDWQETTLSVTTDAITLKDIYLGPFSIRLNWKRLTRDLEEGECFTIVAQEPNPAVSNEDVTHPHVRHEHLCSGDAKVPLRKALEQGRLADAFFLVQGVLTHYNPGSPHVHLEDWEGFVCHDCGTTGSDDDRYSCESCGHAVCSDCLRSCVVCDNARCGECLTRCAVCEESCCSGCLSTCAYSDKECCPNCLGACASCEAIVATDELTAESRLCPNCDNADQEDGEEAVPAAVAEGVMATDQPVEATISTAPSVMESADLVTQEVVSTYAGSDSLPLENDDASCESLSATPA